MPIIVNVREARAHLSRLMDQARDGQEIILAKKGKPYARLVSLAPETSIRRPGRIRGRLGDAFFGSLPENELKAWQAGPADPGQAVLRHDGGAS
jgi:prevent-host-death family protein